jgi:release factor glutamine methyltransferase
MEINVLEHEPETALFVPDTDPLLFYREITIKATQMLAQGGSLFFETNRRYAKDVSAIMRNNGFSDIEIRKDFMGNERMVKGTIKN